MRYAALAILALVAGCTTETISRPAAPPVDWNSLDVKPNAVATGAGDGGVSANTSKERQAGDNYLAALSSPGFAALGNVLNEDAYFAFAGLKDVHGRDNIIKLHQTLLGKFEDRKFVASRRFTTESAQILEWTMSGMDKKSSKSTTFRGVVILRTNDDGSVSNVHLYYDELNAKDGVALMPNEARVEVEQKKDKTESENVAVIRRELDALETKNADAYTATMTDDVQVTALDSLRNQKGKADAKAYVLQMNKSIANLDTSIDDIWGIGDYVVVEYHIVGEQKGPIGRIPAQKDNLLKMFDVDIAQLKDQKISHIWRYDNPAQLLVEAKP